MATNAAVASVAPKADRASGSLLTVPIDREIRAASRKRKQSSRVVAHENGEDRIRDPAGEEAGFQGVEDVGQPRTTPAALACLVADVLGNEELRGESRL